MRPTLSEIQRRIEAVTASSQTPVIVFLKAVFEGEEVIDHTVYDSIEEALTAFRRAHRITSNMSNKIIFIDDVPDVSEAAIIGYTIQD